VSGLFIWSDISKCIPNSVSHYPHFKQARSHSNTTWDDRKCDTG